MFFIKIMHFMRCVLFAHARHKGGAAKVLANEVDSSSWVSRILLSSMKEEASQIVAYFVVAPSPEDLVLYSATNEACRKVKAVVITVVNTALQVVTSHKGLTTYRRRSP